ncbi:MAG: hypothetical protein AVDCRST_MAG19-31 [uncultured Thermomicrobiales bacterium]|uniref:Uncharacterized protein n=1 Tax=uncultured Thermomicrobiales bacterium TaxID=1645740 RepID=A0A6J4U732_9BACT|nr:MAG: hypothetical protein AVDCRST_MAG19-31 [uncultured Thermomicrobiales bacterium]
MGPLARLAEEGSARDDLLAVLARALVAGWSSSCADEEMTASGLNSPVLDLRPTSTAALGLLLVRYFRLAFAAIRHFVSTGTSGTPKTGRGATQAQSRGEARSVSPHSTKARFAAEDRLHRSGHAIADRRNATGEQVHRGRPPGVSKEVDHNARQHLP